MKDLKIHERSNIPKGKPEKGGETNKKKFMEKRKEKKRKESGKTLFFHY